MYLPKHFEQNDVAVIHELMRAHPLATLVTLGSGGLNANHIPLHVCAEPAPLGTLRGHVARANPMWNDFRADVAALAVFRGPQAYISPSWYPTKTQTGRVVPTWNYLAAHACGPLRIIDDPAWVRDLLQTLTTEHEAAQANPWSMRDAPEEFVAKMVAGVVGIEIVISSLTGKYKASQNQPSENRAGVVHALRAQHTDEARAMAAWVESSAG
jgi:transcriptional regulator